MLQVQADKKTLTGSIRQTSIGSIDYTVQIIEAGPSVQIIHTVQSINGITIQWVDNELNIQDWEARVLSKIEETYPKNTTETVVAKEELTEIAW